MTALAPAWLREYDRAWLRADLIAGIVVWSVVAPQAVAYAQIAGLPPAAGLMAAPGALLAYAWLGTSRFLIVSATTATSAVSAAAVGPLAGGDVARFAALSAALALVCAVVLVVAGRLGLGAIADLVSKPVMVGFLFGVGLTVAIAQVPAALGLPGAEGTFFDRLGALWRHVDDVHAETAVVAAASVAALLGLRRIAPRLPAPLIVLGGAIVLSALLDLHGHGVDTVGRIPRALPDVAVPDVSVSDLVNLFAPALGVLIMSAEAVGVSRALAARHDERIEPARDLMALGASNLLAGLSSGFVQSGGASQTAAAEGAGGRTPLTAVVCAVLVLLTGAFLGGVFTDLPQATLAAVVIVAVAGFWDVRELRRIAHVRRSAAVFAGLALTGVLALGVLQGLVVTAGLTLIYVIRLLAGVSVSPLARDDATGSWTRNAATDGTGWIPDDTVVLRADGPLFYANVEGVKDTILRLGTPVAHVVLDLSPSSRLDVQAADALGELADALAAHGTTFTLASVRADARVTLDRTGASERVAFVADLEATRPSTARPVSS
ncbi:SulP family inorganic anion transporter [Baekduia sp. Peel2402]|uniref:SulP family inorganic anion transporter n=1 Tax=Baekduia sp. Peel2402 TaxID=3458296 RepID=UPI00403EB1EF